MERVTRTDVESVCENLNRRLELRGSLSRIKLQGRNGYLAADEYRSDGRPEPYMARTLTAGTKREVYEALWHMIRGIDLAECPADLMGNDGE